MKKCNVLILPEYTYEGLNEKQFKALKIKMIDYPNGYFNDGMQVTYYGGENHRGGFYFVMSLDANVRNKDGFMVNREDIEVDDTLFRTAESILEYMDGIAQELKRIIEENEES